MVGWSQQREMRVVNRTVFYDQVAVCVLLLSDDIHRTRTSEEQKTLVSTPCQGVFIRRYENMQFVSSW